MQKVKFISSIIVPKGNGRSAKINTTPRRRAYFEEDANDGKKNTQCER
jgi:hypothetical protein